MKFKVGDIIKIDKYRAVITKAFEGYYSFMYDDGVVDEQDEGYIEGLGAEIVGRIDDIPELLDKIKNSGVRKKNRRYKE